MNRYLEILTKCWFKRRGFAVTDLQQPFLTKEHKDHEDQIFSWFASLEDLRSLFVVFVSFYLICFRLNQFSSPNSPAASIFCFERDDSADPGFRRR
jgi:hypothetical protein